MALERLKATDTVDKESRTTRLKDAVSSLVDQYSELLRTTRIDGEIRQQVDELRSSVLANSMVQSTSSLMQISDELECVSIVGDQVTVAEEISGLASAHAHFTASGEERLRTVAREMSAALHELEANYYSSSARGMGRR